MTRGVATWADLGSVVLNKTLAYDSVVWDMGCGVVGESPGDVLC